MQDANAGSSRQGISLWCPVKSAFGTKLITFLYLGFMLEVKREETASKGAFFIVENGRRLAELTYSKAGTDRIIIDHTEVSNELRGQDAGKAMVMEAVAYARTHHISIIPLCPFARSVFDKNPELRDVL